MATTADKDKDKDIISFDKKPKAKDDLFTDTGLTEDSLGSVTLDVMGNDRGGKEKDSGGKGKDSGGKKKALWSLDNGVSTGGTWPTDLLAQDTARTEASSTDRSANGATIWITPDGKVGYDAATLFDAFKDQLQSLNTGESLTDSFTYAIRLGDGKLSWATATVRINGVNDAPTGTATAVLAAGSEDTAYTVSASALLAGFSDVDGDTLSVAGLSASNGGVVDNGNGTFTITPTANFNGAVSLGYNVTDGTASITATQSYVLAAVNDAPTGTATAVLAAGSEDTAYTISASALLAGFSDINGDTLSVAGLSASNGGVVDNGNGTFTITPTANFNGAVSLGYNVTDGTASVAATQSYVLAAVIDAIVAGTVLTLSGPSAGAVVVNLGTDTLTDNGVTVILDNGILANAFNVDASAVVTGPVTFIGDDNANIYTASNNGDSITGGEGNDTITSGGGADNITAGAGDDSIRFLSADFTSTDTAGVDSGADTITTQFDANANDATDDLIQIAGALKTAVDDDADGVLDYSASNGTDGGNQAIVGGANQEATVLLDVEVELVLADFTAPGLANVLAELGEEIDFTGIATGQEYLFLINFSVTEIELVMYTAGIGGDDTIVATDIQVLGIVMHNDGTNLVAGDMTF